MNSCNSKQVPLLVFEFSECKIGEEAYQPRSDRRGQHRTLPQKNMNQYLYCMCDVPEQKKTCKDRQKMCLSFLFYRCLVGFQSL
jgi:hypothetical protein